jgi:hypothetical protein
MSSGLASGLVAVLDSSGEGEKKTHPVFLRV